MEKSTQQFGQSRKPIGMPPVASTPQGMLFDPHKVILADAAVREAGAAYLAHRIREEGPDVDVEGP